MRPTDGHRRASHLQKKVSLLMTNSNPNIIADNRTTIVLAGNGQQIPLELRHLSELRVREELRAFCTSCQQITISGWQNVVTAPTEISQFFLELILDSPTTWSFEAQDSCVRSDNPFEAILNTSISRTDLAAIGQATSFAIATAGIVCPAAAQEAANRIRQWLSNNGIQGESSRSLAAQIRRNTAVPETNSHASPQDAARMVLAHLQTVREQNGEQAISSPPVRYHMDDFYLWNGQFWDICRAFEEKVVRILLEVGGETPLTKTFVSSVVMVIKGLVQLDANELRPPLHIIDETEQQIRECQVIGTENGIIDVAAIGCHDSTIQVYPLTPAMFEVPRLPYQYIAPALCPLWLHTLTEILATTSPADHRIDVLQEFFGYCLLSANHRFETFLILIGDGSNGKSVILEVLSALLGKRNVSHVPLDAFGGEFRNAEMIGKLANIATDMQRMPRVHEGILKQLVSGEPIQINRKHKPPVSMYPTAKLIFATNHLPPFSDTSDGLWRRMLVIPFFIQFMADRIDRHRARRIVAEELPGVLNWALEGARRLTVNDTFTRCDVCEGVKGGHRHDSDPFQQFLDECCERGPGLSILVDTLYRAYRGFCDECGKMPKAKSEFGKQIARVPGVARERETTASRRYYYYNGIGCLPTVLVNPDQDYRHQRYQSPFRQELYPPANRHRRRVEETLSSSSPDASPPPDRGMNPETT